MSGPAHSWTATIPLAAARSRAASRARARCSGVSRSRAAARTRWWASAVSGRCAIEALRRGQAGREPSQCGRRRGGVDVHTGQVGGPVTDHAVEVVGARRRGFRPARLVPAVPPDRSAGMGLRVFGDQRQAVGHRCGRAQIEAGEREAGRGEVHVAVDECRGDEAAVEVDDVGVGELRPADVVAAQPHDDAVTDGHRGGVGHGRTVDPAAQQERRQTSRDGAGGAAARRPRRRSLHRRCSRRDRQQAGGSRRLAAATVISGCPSERHCGHHRTGDRAGRRHQQQCTQDRSWPGRG